MEKMDKEGIKNAEPFYPHHVIRQGILMLMVFALLIALATFFPAPMEPKADPFSTPEHIKPEWYFLAGYQFLKLAEGLAFLGQWAPKTIGVLGQALLGMLVVLLPFIDRSSLERNPRRRPVMMTIGAIGLIGFVVLTIWGHYS